MKEKGPMIVPIRALLKLRNPLAIEALRNNHKELGDDIDDIFNRINDRIFIPALRKWLTIETTAEMKAYLIATLGNCGDIVKEDLNEIMGLEDIKSQRDYTVVRAIGCYGDMSHVDHLLVPTCIN